MTDTAKVRQDDWLRFRRFFDYAPGDCWLWKGHCNSETGYGYFRYNNGQRVAHRFAYMALIGPIPPGAILDHLCREPSCVNPIHLEPTDHRTNINRGIGVAPRFAVRTSCSKGHPFDLVNTRWQGGRRWCRACERERAMITNPLRKLRGKWWKPKTR